MLTILLTKTNTIRTKLIAGSNKKSQRGILLGFGNIVFTLQPKLLSSKVKKISQSPIIFVTSLSSFSWNTNNLTQTTTTNLVGSHTTVFSVANGHHLQKYMHNFSHTEIKLTMWYFYKVLLRPFLVKPGQPKNYIEAQKVITLKLAKDMCSVIWFIEEPQYRIKSVKLVRLNRQKIIQCIVASNAPPSQVAHQVYEAPFADTVWESDGYDFYGWVLDCREIVSFKKMSKTRAPKLK